MFPEFNENGDLPVGIYPGTISAILERFGAGSNHRQTAAGRLKRIYQLAQATEYLDRFIVFGSFITDKEHPNDVDVVIIMRDEFDPDSVSGEARLLFDNAAAQSHFGASVFWLRRFAIFGDPQEFIKDWQFKRNRQRRGIVEIIGDVT